MAVKLSVNKTKLKNSAKPKITAAKDGIAAATELVPEASELKKKIALLAAQSKAIQKQLDPIEAKILGFVDGDLAGDESIDLVNGEHVLSVSAKGQLRSIKNTDDVVIACEAFEEGLALKLAKFNLTDLDKYFSPDEMLLLTEIKEGKLRLKYA
jgi:hypothetical protein